MSDPNADAARLVAWLEVRTEAAPASLRPRLTGAIGGAPGAESETLGDLLSHAGERLLAKLLAEGCGDREAAPDLLAADALVTYAFEATAEDATLSAKAIDARAASAMRRVATLGDAL